MLKYMKCYPPIRSQEAIDLVIRQAEVLAMDWEKKENQK